uniref:T1SS secreted agglutinin RTX n=1 Tax=Magnetococcus massalia (strain MO-1) TaxID=451514 RepID=A0A1S7LR69_MAGMO|nr:protein of unknown function [Candidatus Magnetococcus massalia]
MSAVTGDGESYSLDGVQVKPPADSNENFALGIDVTTVDSNGVTSDSQQTSGTISVEVASVADEATIDAGDITATEDAGAIALNLDAAVGDTDGSESITAIDISGVPDTVQLSAGTDNGDGSWSLTPDQLQGLTATVDGDVSGVFDMSVTAHVLDADSDSGGDDTIATTKDFTLTINPEADGVSITDGSASGNEDEWIAVEEPSFTLSDVDGSESINAVTITGIPDGAELQLEDGTSINVSGDSAEIPMSAITSTGESSYTIAGLEVKAPCRQQRKLHPGCRYHHHR